MMSSNRNFTSVIGDMIGLIPSEVEEEEGEELRRRLECVLEGSLYRAPELMHRSWAEALVILYDEFGTCDIRHLDGWQLKVAETLRGPESDEVS